MFSVYNKQPYPTISVIWIILSWYSWEGLSYPKYPTFSRITISNSMELAKGINAFFSISCVIWLTCLDDGAIFLMGHQGFEPWSIKRRSRYNTVILVARSSSDEIWARLSCLERLLRALWHAFSNDRAGRQDQRPDLFRRRSHIFNGPPGIRTLIWRIKSPL